MIDKIIAWCGEHRGMTFGAVAILAAWAWWCLGRTHLDAIPDLSDTQVIIYSKWNQAPDLMEDQVTYPIIRALLGAPKVKAIRGFSDYGFSYVYVIFQDGTDLYWARSRVLEYLSKVLSELPPGVQTEIGPDATSVGWVYEYALMDRNGNHTLDLGQLRALQDWHLRYDLEAVPGVAEVATVGGFTRQVQVVVDPAKLQADGVSILQVAKAVQDANVETGARVVEFSGTEFMVRGRGYATTPRQYGEAVVKWDPTTGTALRVKDVAEVSWGPDMRRGAADLNGMGEAVGGVVVMRQGADVPTVIAGVKAKLDQIRKSLPPGVEIVPVYDRSKLIERAMDTVRHELKLQLIVVSLVIILFLWHFPSSLGPILSLPVCVLLAFIPMYYLGVSANIMSMAGIAVAIGAMVDASVVMVENSHKHLEPWASGRAKGDFKPALIQAVQEVARPAFFSLLVIAMAFLPVFSLQGQEGRMFKPMAYTNNLSMVLAALAAVTLVPALLLTVIRLKEYRFRPAWLCRLANRVLVGRIHREEEHPVSRALQGLYHPVADWVLRNPRKTILAALLALAATVPVYFRLGSEFVPELDEGTLLYMPTGLPGMSIGQAKALLRTQDKLIKQFPEVDTVFGKAGRADTPTDVAPLAMFETTITLKPREEWPGKKRWYSGWMPGWLKPAFRWAWPDRMSTQELIDKMDAKLKFAGMPNVWVMPIKNRIDMLSTGIRTPVGIKILGPDLNVLQKIGERLESLLSRIPGTLSVVAERTGGGHYLDVAWDRARLSHFGISMAQAQKTLDLAVGGENVTNVIRGIERFPVNVRYPRELRQNVSQIRHVLVATPEGSLVALGELADVHFAQGPPMIRNDNGQPANYVTIDFEGRDLGGYVKEAQKLVAAKLKLPTGYTLEWSGQYENMKEANRRLEMILPLTLALIFVLLYLNTNSVAKTLVVLMAVPFSLIGAIWLLWALHYNLSVAVAVGMIALAGLDAETGVFMLLYLDLAYDAAVKAKRMKTPENLKEAIMQGAVKRVRPKVMTVACAFIGLLPVLFSNGTGAEVMRRIAAPMLGGLFSSFALELIVYPAVYYLWKRPSPGHPLPKSPAPGIP